MHRSTPFAAEHVVREDDDATKDETTPVFLDHILRFLFVPIAILVTIALLRYIIRRHLRNRTRPLQVPRPFRESRAFEPPPPVYATYVVGRPRNTIIVPHINQSASSSLHRDSQYSPNYAPSFASAFFNNATEPHKDIHLRSFQADDENKKLPCPICLDPLETEPVSAGKCNHMMHTSCLRGWLAKDVNSACPICRAPYDDSASRTSLSSSAAAPL